LKANEERARSRSGAGSVIQWYRQRIRIRIEMSWIRKEKLFEANPYKLKRCTARCTYIRVVKEPATKRPFTSGYSRNQRQKRTLTPQSTQGTSDKKTTYLRVLMEPVFRIHDILMWIRIRGSMSLPKLFEGTFTSFFKDKKSKRSHKL
jgi:hypothetical protein